MLAILLGALPRLCPVDATIDANNVWSLVSSSAASNNVSSSTLAALRWPVRLAPTIVRAVTRLLIMRGRPAPHGVGSSLALSVWHAALATLRTVVVETARATHSSPTIAELRRARRRDAVVDAGEVNIAKAT